MFSALPFALLLLTTLSGGSALPNAGEPLEEKTTSGTNNTGNDAKEPIALKEYSQARFLLGTSTNTRFVTTTTSTIITCVSAINTAAVACTTGRKRRAIKLVKAANKGLLDSSLREFQEDVASSGRLLFSAGTIFTTLTFTQVVDTAGVPTVSISLQCIPPTGTVSLCPGR